MLTHLLGVFWGAKDYISTLTYSLPQPGYSLLDMRLFGYKWHNTGPLGVALFYLISGFVIPFSFRHHNRFSFLGARLLRIYPVYIACIGIDVAILYASATYWDKPFTLTWAAVMQNLMLTQNIFFYPSIDTVNITLGTEIRFYFLCFLLFGWIRAGKAWPVYGLALLLTAICAGLNLPADLFKDAADHFDQSDIIYVVFMLIGVLFHFHYEGRLGTAKLAAGSAVLMALFAACLEMSKPVIFYTILNYVYALALFALAYGLRGRFRKTRLLDGLAAISYPLYLVHPILGYSLMRVLIVSYDVGPWPAFFIAAGSAMSLAGLLHVVLERPSIAWGRALSRRSPVEEPVSQSV